MTAYAAELELAKELARLGGRIALRHFRRDPQAKRKGDGTWVTEADWAVEAQIRLRITRAFPEHNVLGEEEGLTGAGGGRPIDGAPTWILDPIDGTNNYIAGIPIWATLVALQVDGTSVLGVCHAPALGETYDAAIGASARMNDEPITVDPVERLDDATVVDAGAKRLLEPDLREFYATVCRRAARTRGFGDFWGHMLVARGSAHVMIEADVSLWDVAALEVIVGEAGGRTTHLDGTPWRGRGTCLTTNGALHGELVKLYGSSGGAGVFG